MSIPGPVQQQRAQPVQLQRDANELAALAKSIPQAIDQLSKGMRPTDLDEKLRKIEKLSKRLRSSVNDR